MLSVFAAVGIGVSLLIPIATKRLSLGHYAGGVCLWACGLFTLGTTDNRALVTVCVAVAGAGLSLASQARVYILQTQLPRNLLGQGFSAAAVLLYAANTASLVGFEILASRWGTNALIILSGTLLLLVGVGLSTRAHRGTPRTGSATQSKLAADTEQP